MKITIKPLAWTTIDGHFGRGYLAKHNLGHYSISHGDAGFTASSSHDRSKFTFGKLEDAMHHCQLDFKDRIWENITETTQTELSQ